MEATQNVPWSIRPTLLSRVLLGQDGSRHAWEYVRMAYLENPLPGPMRTALLCAAWEAPDQHGLAIHNTGMSLLGQEQQSVDLEATWRSLMESPDTRSLLAATVRISNGLDVPGSTMQEILGGLGAWRRAWQDLVVYAGWADRLYRIHAPEVAPLEDPRMEPWLTQLVKARDVLSPILPS